MVRRTTFFFTVVDLRRIFPGRGLRYMWCFLSLVFTYLSLTGAHARNDGASGHVSWLPSLRLLFKHSDLALAGTERRPLQKKLTYRLGRVRFLVQLLQLHCDHKYPSLPSQLVYECEKQCTKAGLKAQSDDARIEPLNTYLRLVYFLCFSRP